MPRTIVFCTLAAALAIPVAGDELAGYSPHQPSSPPQRPEDLFHGDLIEDMGLGCANTAGTSGGPNDAAQGVTATISPPFNITAHYYYVYTLVSPTITALSFVCWQDLGSGPGLEMARRAGLDWDDGPHTVAIDPPILVGTMTFFFGQNQPQTNAGIRWGFDINSSAERSYIRAPACGAAVFTLVDALGYPGNWCMSVTVEQSTPLELQSWGLLKNAYR